MRPLLCDHTTRLIWCISLSFVYLHADWSAVCGRWFKAIFAGSCECNTIRDRYRDGSDRVIRVVMQSEFGVDKMKRHLFRLNQ